MLRHLHADLESIDVDRVLAAPLPLNSGSPDFGIPPSVQQAVKRRVDTTRQLAYPSTCGEGLLREAIAAFNAEHLKLRHEPADIVVTYGAMQGLFDVVRAVCRGRDDEVLLPVPYWFQFPHIVTLAGATPRDVATLAEDAFKLTPRGLSRSITASTRLLILTNPNNPTGLVYTPAELDALASVIAAHPDLLVISDEVYNLLGIRSAPTRLDPCASLGSVERIADQVFTVNSFAKNHAMSGLRVGYVAAPKRLASAVCQAQRFSSLGVNTYLQAGGLAAVESTQEIVLPIVGKLATRLEKAEALLRETLPRMPFTRPEAGYYLWVSVKSYLGLRAPDGTLLRTDEDLMIYLRDEAGVAVVPGTACGVPGYFRLTFAIDERVFERGVRLMKEHLDRLRAPHALLSD